MNWGVALALIPLLGLLALASYVDRVHQVDREISLARISGQHRCLRAEVEPNLHVSRARASLSMSGASS